MQRRNIKVVIVGMNTYVGEVVKHSNYIQIKDAIQIHMNPMNNQVSVIPPLFGKLGDVTIYEPTNVIMYDVDDKLLEQYEKATSAFRSGIIPVNQLPPNVNNSAKEKGVKLLIQKQK